MNIVYFDNYIYIFYTINLNKAVKHITNSNIKYRFTKEGILYLPIKRNLNEEGGGVHLYLELNQPPLTSVSLITG